MKDHDDDDDDEWVPEKEASSIARGRGFPTSNSAETYLPHSSSQAQQQQQQAQLHQRMPFSEPLHRLSDTAVTPEPSYCQVRSPFDTFAPQAAPHRISRTEQIHCGSVQPIGFKGTRSAGGLF